MDEIPLFKECKKKDAEQKFITMCNSGEIISTEKLPNFVQTAKRYSYLPRNFLPVEKSLVILDKVTIPPETLDFVKAHICMLEKQLPNESTIFYSGTIQQDQKVVEEFHVFDQNGKYVGSVFVEIPENLLHQKSTFFFASSQRTFY